MSRNEATTGRPPLHGRRQGRKLRGGQRDLMERRLPALRVALPASGAPIDPRRWFGDPPPRAVWLEIGTGAGEHLTWQAARHPDVGFLAAEFFVNGIASLLGKVEAGNLANVRIFQDDGRVLLAGLPDRSLERIVALFPDPWRKRRHHKRRLVRRPTLDDMARVLRDGGELRLATDHGGYLAWMLRHATDHPAFRWLAEGPDDWRTRPDDWPRTRYEEKALAAGRRPGYLRFVRRPRDHPAQGLRKPTPERPPILERPLRGL